MKLAKAFDLVVTGVSWLSIILRVAQFLLFSNTDAIRRGTFGVLALLLGLVGVTSGLRVT